MQCRQSTLFLSSGNVFVSTSVHYCIASLKCHRTTVMSEQDVIQLQHPAGHSAAVALQGATVVSWKVKGEEKLFVSSKRVMFPCTSLE